MKQKMFRLSALIGILIFAFIIYKIGPMEIWNNISRISLANFFILVGLRVLYWLLRSLSWKAVVETFECNISFLNLFKARMAGHAVSQLTPTAQLGSEATRIYMANCSNKKISVASVIIDKTIEFLVVVVFTFIGVTMTLYRISLPQDLKLMFIAGLLISASVVLFFIVKQQRGMLGWILDIFAKIRIKPKFIEKNREKIIETDQYISEFYRKHPGGFIKTFLLYSLLILLWSAEIHIGLVYIGVTDISFINSFLITVLGNLAFIFPVVPGSLGVYEATYIGLFALFGMSAGAALTLVLIRRIIALMLAGFGLIGFLFPTKPEKMESVDNIYHNSEN